MRWLLIVAALAVGGCEVRGGGSAPASARFTLAADEEGGVWRLDSQSGELKHCMAGNDAQVHCSAAAP